MTTRKLDASHSFAFLAGRCAARRDAAMERARLETANIRSSYVRLARVMNRWMLDELKRSREWM